MKNILLFILLLPFQIAFAQFGNEQIIHLDETAFPTAILSADLDGDLDALSSSAFDGKIAWYENFLIENIPLIDSEGQWNIYQPYQFTPPVGHPFFNQKIEATAIYFFDGDTLINDNLYHKIYQTAQPIVDRQNPNNQYVGALREAGQQVYWIRQLESVERLLYDYDLTVGDTMWVDRFEIDFIEKVQIILESIDSVQTLDQRIRRRFNFSIFKPEFDTIPRYFTSWIEGIGNIGEQGFLETHVDELVETGFFDIFNGEQYTSFLQCFSKQDELVYQSENSDVCFTIPNYIPFPTENGVWRTLETRADNFAPIVFGTTEQTRTYFIAGDTIIDAKVYQKIYTTQTATPPITLSENQYHGAFREADKVIYYLDKQSTTERTLYNFNLTVGDTITTIFNDIGQASFLFVGQIDTIQTADKLFRKRYEIRRADTAINNTQDIAFSTFSYWIEGIGDVELGLFSFPDVVSPFVGKDEFQCFSINNELVYQNAIFDNCYRDTASYRVEYTPLVVENATWILVDSYDDFTINDYTAYKIQGDTIINDVAYKKLFYYELEKTGATQFQILNQSTVGYLREDSNTKQILFLPDARGGNIMSNEDLLLLDFNKTVGEEFDDLHIKNKEIQESITITQDTILELFGQYRRVLTNGGIQLIEGIGYKEGLFKEPTGLVTQAASSSIFDYCIGDNFNCNLLTNTKEPIRQKVDIFPNPTTTLLTLQLEQPIKGQIKLKSVAGQVVYATNFSGIQHQIEVDELPKGIYFLHLQAEEGYLVRKIIIQ